MAASVGNNAIVVGAFNSVEGKVVEVPTHPEINEKVSHAGDDSVNEKSGSLDIDITAAPVKESEDGDEPDKNSAEALIITGADAAAHLLPMRDDGDNALTFRGIFIATILSGFQAVVYQIYQVSQTPVAQITHHVCAMLTVA